LRKVSFDGTKHEISIDTLQIELQIDTRIQDDMHRLPHNH